MLYDVSKLEDLLLLQTIAYAIRVVMETVQDSDVVTTDN